MEENSFKTADGLRFRCKSCSGQLRYDIGSGRLVCESCGNGYAITSIPDPSLDDCDNCMDTVEYICPSCGASLHTSQTAATTFCSYCGSDVVLSERLSRIKRPAKIVPFRLTREDAEKKYRERLAESKCLPSDMLAQETMDHFRPIYIPYWHYSFNAKGMSEGRGIKRYHDNEYDYEEEYDIELDGDIKLTGLLYDASSAFEDDTAQKLGFNTRFSVPFHAAYLCGLYAEAADTADVVYAKAMEKMAKEKFSIYAAYKSGTDGAFDLPKERTGSAELVFMPVWLLANRQGGRVLYTAVNGASGEIVCEPTVSVPRFTLLTAGLFAAILAVLLIITHWLTLRPNLVLMCCGILSVVFMRQIVPAMDEILIQRTRDTDPTREMKRNSPEADRSVVDESAKQQNKKTSLKLSDIIGTALKIIFSFGGIPAILIFILVADNIGEIDVSGVIAFLISDRSIFTPCVLIVSFILLLRHKYTYRSVQADPGRKKAGVIDWLILVALRILLIVGAGVMLSSAPGVKLWCYGLSIAIMTLLVVSMLRLNHFHNEFVTRPVPFFGKEAQS